jgi:hypothetical protein
MPAAFDACVKGGGRVRTKKLGGGKYMHICFKDGKSFAGEVKKKEALKWDSTFILEDFAPEEMECTNHQTDDGGAGKSMKGKKIKGVLLRKESRNGRVYEIDGMIKAEKFANLPLPISMNHGDDVSDNVGLINKLIPMGDGLDYEGTVFNTAKYPDAIEMMQKGLINRISIEADNPMQEEIDGKVIIKGFDLMGAGFVKYAGIPSASATIAEAIENIEKTEFEVELMEENKDLDAKLAKIEAFETAEKKKAIEEAEKANLAEKAKITSLEETVLALQSEMKSMKEKKSGIITGDTSTTPSPKFVFEGQKSDKAMFYPENPSEFY